ncbi:unnamed protein product [Leuciscus chuanchicus]
MNQLGFIRPDRRCSDTIHVLACSATITCWVNSPGPGGPYPWIQSRGPVHTTAIAHVTDARPFSLVLQISRKEWNRSACRKQMLDDTEGTAAWYDSEKISHSVGTIHKLSILLVKASRSAYESCEHCRWARFRKAISFLLQPRTLVYHTSRVGLMASVSTGL